MKPTDTVNKYLHTTSSLPLPVLSTIVHQSPSRPTGHTQQLLHPSIATKISAITVKFESGNLKSDRDISTNLIDIWQSSHNRKLNSTVCFGYMEYLLVFANDCNTFEDLMTQPHRLQLHLTIEIPNFDPPVS